MENLLNGPKFHFNTSSGSEIIKKNCSKEGSVPPPPERTFLLLQNYLRVKRVKKMFKNFFNMICFKFHIYHY